MKLHRVGVSQLVYLLYKPESYGRLPPKEVLDKGRMLHWKLGFDNTERFTRYYEFDEENLFKISGVPDKIDEKEGVVEELKTYHPRYNNIEVVKNIGIAQLYFYAFLTGLYKLKLHLLNSQTNEITTEAFEADDDTIAATVHSCLTKYLITMLTPEQILKKAKKELGDINEL